MISNAVDTPVCVPSSRLTEEASPVRLRPARPSTTTIARTATATALTAALSFTLLATPGTAQDLEARNPATDEYPIELDLADLEPEVVVVEAENELAVSRLVSTGYEVVEEPEAGPGGVMGVQVVATRSQQRQLEAMGYDVLERVVSAADFAAVSAEREQMAAEVAAAEAVETDELSVLRAEWLDNMGKLYLNLEVRSSAGASADTIVTAGYGDTTITLSRFVDAGEYQYHRVNSPVPVSEVPDSVTFTSSAGDVETSGLDEWLGEELPPYRRSYATGFVDRYMDATEITAQAEELAAEFPELAEIIELPNETNGYRRKAMATVGTLTTNAVVYTTTAWGHEGGNDVTVQHVDPGSADAPLSVSVAGDAVTVSLGTDAAGAVTSTAAQVAAAVNASAASSLLSANTYRGNAGAAPALPGAVVQMDDFLNAPDSVSREPFTVKAIRIGEKRDGTKTGVLAYSQEHAREWVTPLVSLEAAERLLRNYDNDPQTRSLLRDLDIFIIPTVNPDGTHYSIHDNALQRRNMTSYCGPGQPNDSGARNAWGVDLNRNFTVGSRLDGYDGASGSCTSDVYSGPSELSEPEAKNEVWLTENNPNIKFAMNIHSHGGYFMWAPGAYVRDGRQTLPRPTQAEEDYFWASSSTILSRIQDERGTAIWPGRTGPVADVLYSAAGNSADEHWYNNDIFAWNFEVGSPLWSEERQRWEAVGFQPPFAEGYEESQEFAAGIIGMLEVAQAYGTDRIPPRSLLKETEDGWTFESTEPATIHYTTDGSRPTYDSPRIQPAEVRGDAETLDLGPGRTTVRWFSVDIAGNVEKRYDPLRSIRGFNQKTVTVP
ncbi:M14 family metallopeptidase [Jannaschia sp. R86511]|uniref:M14 family metallopeptidase n=1 Tax=Jannaschia sp. R86511 TaxID=3093853 RepID=UPI0036D3B63A